MARTQRELRRTHEDGAVFIDGNVATRRLVEQRVAWCATDNLGMSRKEASAAAVDAGRVLSRGEKFVLGPFTFELVEL
jgi:hypothetical protein